MNKPATSLVMAALAAGALVGCERAIVGVDGQPISHGSGGSGTTSGVTSTSGASGATIKPTALALMGSELPANSMPCGFNMCTPPADTLFIEIASLGNTCQSPLGAQNPSITNWQRQIGLPAKYQAIGTYPLSDPAVFYEGEEHMIGQSGPASGVTSGAPGAGQGTIEVLSIDKTQITVRLQGTTQNLPEDGDYVATRCTPLP